MGDLRGRFTPRPERRKDQMTDDSRVDAAQRRLDRAKLERDSKTGTGLFEWKNMSGGELELIKPANDGRKYIPNDGPKSTFMGDNAFYQMGRLLRCVRVVEQPKSERNINATKVTSTGIETVAPIDPVAPRVELVPRSESHREAPQSKSILVVHPEKGTVVEVKLHKRWRRSEPVPVLSHDGKSVYLFRIGSALEAVKRPRSWKVGDPWVDKESKAREAAESEAEDVSQEPRVEALPEPVQPPAPQPPPPSPSSSMTTSASLSGTPHSFGIR